MPAPRKRRNSDLAYEASGSVSKKLKTVRAQERRRSTRGTQKTVPEPEPYDDDPEPDLFTHPPTSSAPGSPVFEDDEPLPPPPFPVPFNVPTTPIASGSHQNTPSTPIQNPPSSPMSVLDPSPAKQVTRPRIKRPHRNPRGVMEMKRSVEYQEAEKAKLREEIERLNTKMKEEKARREQIEKVTHQEKSKEDTLRAQSLAAACRDII